MLPEAHGKERDAGKEQERKEKRVEACLVVDSLDRRERDSLGEDVSHPVQSHRLTPIIERARHEHLVGVVRPTCKCEQPASQRSNASELVPVSVLLVTRGGCAHSRRPSARRTRSRSARELVWRDSPLENERPHRDYLPCVYRLSVVSSDGRRGEKREDAGMGTKKLERERERSGV